MSDKVVFVVVDFWPPGASLKTETRDSMSVSEILKRVANQKGGSLLSPVSSTDGGNPTLSLTSDPLPNVQSSQAFPNLSMSLGLGGLILPNHDEGLLLRARASHDSQQRSHNKMDTSLGGSLSSGGSGDATGVQVGENALLTTGVSNHRLGRSLDAAARLASGSQDIIGLQSVHKHELGKKALPFGEVDARFKQDWTEDELDSLWTGNSPLSSFFNVLTGKYTEQYQFVATSVNCISTAGS